LDTIEIKGNKNLFVIAFVNLFKNAYLYSENKTVKVNVHGTQNQIIVIIANNGKTISLEEQNKLFEPFMRGENAKTKSGLGLGLRIVKRILNLQNASISYAISSDNKNTFTVSFAIN
jgi:two-component system, OmpR family, sensor histidine kinase ArlS